MLPRYIARRYRVLNLLGRGALGQVFLVFDQETRQRVALKLLNPEAKGFEQRFHTFKNEFDALRSFSHRNIVKVYDIGQEDAGAPYFTMEHIVGPNLIEHGFAGVEDLVQLLGQLLRGLQYVHSRNYLHRDIKGGNVLVQIGDAAGDEGDTPKLLDFGFAVRGAPDAQLRGTAEYLSPEVLLGGAVDARADLYAVGCIAYIMLTGHYPGGGRYPGAGRDVSRIRSDFERRRLPRSPRHHAPEIPTALESLVMQLLSFDPSSRPSSASEVLDALATLHAGGLKEDLKDTLDLAERWPYLDAGGLCRRLVERLERRQSGLALVVGHRRHGKSRLLEELRAEMAGRGAEVILCRFTESGDPTRAPLSRIPRRIASFHPERRKALHEASPLLLGSELLPEDPALAMSRLEDELVALLFPEVVKRPVVVLIDDGQWADLESLQVVIPAARRIVARVPDDSVFLLVAAATPGSEIENELSGRDGATAEVLRPLDGSDVRGLLERLGEWSEGMESVAELLSAEAGGIPGVMEAHWKELHARRAVACVRGKWRARPDLLAGERHAPREGWPELSRLSAEERDVLTAVAAFDRWVTVTEVESVCAVREVSTLSHLERIAGLGLLRRTERHFRIATGSLRSHLYEGLAPRSRRALHGRIARAIERIHRADRMEHLAELAAHWARSSDEKAGFRWSVEAARALAAQHRPSRAIAPYRDAIRLARSGGTQAPALLVEIELELARACITIGSLDEARQAIVGAREALRGRVDLILEAQVAATDAEYRLVSWRQRQVETVGEIEDLCQALSSQERRLASLGASRDAQAARWEVLRQLGQVGLRMGRYDQALDAFHECLLIGRTLGRKDGNRLLGLLAAGLLRGGRLPDSARTAEKALEQATNDGDEHGAAEAHAQLALIGASQDRIDDAVSHFDEGERRFRLLRAPTLLADHRQNYADFLVEIGMTREASRLAHEVLDHYGRDLGGSKSARARLVMGKAMYRLCDYPRAESELSAVLEHAERKDIKDPGLRWQPMVYLGRARVEMGQAAEGRRLLEEVIQRAGVDAPGGSSLHVFVCDCVLALSATHLRDALAAWLEGLSPATEAEAARAFGARARELAASIPGVQSGLALAMESAARAATSDASALPDGERALQEVRRFDARLALAETAYYVAMAALWLDRPGDGLEVIGTAIRALEPLQVPELQGNALALAMLCLQAQGMAPLALAHHRERLDLIKTVLSQFTSRDDQERYLSERLRANLYRRGRELLARAEDRIHV